MYVLEKIEENVVLCIIYRNSWKNKVVCPAALAGLPTGNDKQCKYTKTDWKKQNNGVEKYRGKIKPYKGIKRTEMKKISKILGRCPYGLRRWKSGAVMLILAAALSFGGCKTIQYVPIKTDTQVEVKDSTVFHIKDSVRIIEKSRWKDYGGLLDTLRIRGNRSEMRAWADTTKNIINGSLEEDPQEEKTRIVYRDRWHYRDSIQKVEVPVEVPVEVEKKVVPKFWRVFGMLGIVFSTLVLAFAGLKVYRFFKFRK